MSSWKCFWATPPFKVTIYIIWLKWSLSPHDHSNKPKKWLWKRQLRSFKLWRGPVKDVWEQSWIYRAETWTEFIGPRTLGQLAWSPPRSASRRFTNESTMPLLLGCTTVSPKICMFWFYVRCGGDTYRRGGRRSPVQKRRFFSKWFVWWGRHFFLFFFGCLSFVTKSLC